MQLQLVFQDKTLLQHPSILFGIARPQLLGKNLGAGSAQQRLQLLEATALHQRLIGHDVTCLNILDEDRGVGDGVEHR
ncbi:hypothetical protein D3C78_1834970 [compost metagenome]